MFSWVLGKLLPTQQQTRHGRSYFPQMQRCLSLPSSLLLLHPSPVLVLMVQRHILSRWRTRWVCAAAAVVALDWGGCFEADGSRHTTGGIQALRPGQQAAAESVLVVAESRTNPSKLESSCRLVLHTSSSPLTCSWTRPCKLAG